MLLSPPRLTPVGIPMINGANLNKLKTRCWHATCLEHYSNHNKCMRSARDDSTRIITPRNQTLGCLIRPPDELWRTHVFRN